MTVLPGCCPRARVIAPGQPPGSVPGPPSTVISTREERTGHPDAGLDLASRACQRRLVLIRELCADVERSLRRLTLAPVSLSWAPGPPSLLEADDSCPAPARSWHLLDVRGRRHPDRASA